MFRQKTYIIFFFVSCFTRYLPTPTNLQLWKLDKKVKDSIKRMIDARLKSNFMNYGDNLLGIKLKAATSKESETAMRMDEIIEECKAIYISGQVNSMIDSVDMDFVVTELEPILGRETQRRGFQ